MKASRYLIWPGVLIVIVGLSSSLWEERRLTRATAALAASVRVQTALSHELNALDQRARGRAAEWERARRSANRVFAQATTAKTPPPADRLSADQISAEDARASRAIHATMDLKYRPLLERLGVSADAITQWEDAAVRYDQRMRDIAAAARDQHLSLSDPAIAELRRAETAKMMEKETILIGPEAHAEVARLSALTPVTNLVEQLAGMQFASDAPLTPAQGEQLTNLIANASPAFQQGRNVVLSAIDWDHVYAQAQPILAPAQLQALRDILSDMQTRSALSQRINALLHH